MKVLYFECNCGISGDMVLSCLLDLGVDFSYFKQQLATLGIEDEYTISQASVMKQGIRANHICISLKEHHHHHHEHHEHHHGRNLKDIIQLIEQSSLNQNIKVMAKRMFQIVADAEGAVHNLPPDQVHFHEVGAVDSILDIVGTAICIDALAPDAVYCSPLQEGTGSVQCAHGLMPVPAPATAEILRQHHIPFYITDESGEMVTPTGAAIAAALSQGFTMPTGCNLIGIGYGSGTREFKRANILRAFLLESGQKEENVLVLETNVDDCSGEMIGFALEQVMLAGALDAFSTPIFMKKGRPAQKITVLCSGDTRKQMEDILFTHLSTIGIRCYSVERTTLPRRQIVCDTPYGSVETKISEWNGKKKIAPEYEAVRKLAIEKRLPFLTIYDAAKEAYIQGQWKVK